MSIRLPQNTAAPLTVAGFIASPGANYPITLCAYIRVDGWNSSGTVGLPILGLSDSAADDKVALRIQGTSAAQSIQGELVTGGSGVYWTNDLPNDFSAVWRPAVIVFESSTARHIYTRIGANVTQVVSNTYGRSFADLLTDLTILETAWANGDVYVDNLQIYTTALTQTEAEEFFDTGTVADQSAYVEWDTSTDWGAGDIQDVSGNTRHITPPSGWVYSTEAPVLSGGADTTPPTLSNPTLTVNSNTAVTFGATSDEDGAAHAVVRLASDPQASGPEIVNGTYANAVVVPADVDPITANVAYQFAQVTGLTGNTQYAVDQVATDAAGNISAVNTQTFTTQSAEVQVTISGGANLTGLDYVLFDSQDLATAGILKQGAGESTDASGNLVIDVNDVSVTDGQAVYYVIGDTSDTQIAGGPATVSIA